MVDINIINCKMTIKNLVNYINTHLLEDERLLDIIDPSSNVEFKEFQRQNDIFKKHYRRTENDILIEMNVYFTNNPVLHIKFLKEKKYDYNFIVETSLRIDMDIDINNKDQPVIITIVHFDIKYSGYQFKDHDSHQIVPGTSNTKMINPSIGCCISYLFDTADDFIKDYQLFEKSVSQPVFWLWYNRLKRGESTNTEFGKLKNYLQDDGLFDYQKLVNLLIDKEYLKPE